MQSSGDAVGGGNGTGNVSNNNGIYRVSYPLECTTCTLCCETLTSIFKDLKEHFDAKHSTVSIVLFCRLCMKEHQSIRSVSTHYVSCSKKQAQQIVVTPNVGITPANITTVPDKTKKIVAKKDNLSCTVCLSTGVTLVFDQKIGLVTHMRHKHPNEYEDSKEVASIRVGWSSDEDMALARLEVRLKKESKGQILNRLALEWSKLVTVGGGTPRSKGAIIGRRQNSEYKRILAEIMEEDQSPTVDTTDSDSSNTLDADSTTDSDSKTETSDDDDDFVEKIQNFLDQQFLVTKTKLAEGCGMVLRKFIDNPRSVDLVEEAHQQLMIAIDGIRSRRTGRTTDTSTKHTKEKRVIRNASRKRKSELYKCHQSMYYKEKDKLVSIVLDGMAVDAEPPPIEVASNFFKGIWSTTADDNEDYEIKKGMDYSKIMLPITVEEIKLALDGTKRKVACGPDQVQIAEVRMIPVTSICIAFNIWMACKRIPAILKLNRTVLLPKGTEGLDDIKNWRPVTIASTLLRLYNKVLSTRLSSSVHINDNQVGFRALNGCARNITWLNLLLRDARRQRKDLYTCLLDVSKAFDCVPHQSIVRALKRNAVPSQIIEIIMDQYCEVYSYIAYKNVSSRRIKLNRGVKQGDPLSSILFNLVMDELFEVLKLDYAYEVNAGLKTNVRCFADDIVLTSGSVVGMNIMLSNTKEFLARRGLKLNPKKFVSIGLAKAWKGKKSKIITEPIFTMDGETIPILGMPPNTVKYLGIKFSSLGAIEVGNVWAYIRQTLSKVEEMRIKPQNKIDILRTYIVPRYIYVLTYTEVYPKMLHQVDRRIRQLIRRILHLPQSLSNEFFYLPISDGGLQISCLHDIVGISKIKVHKNIKLSNDAVLKYLVNEYATAMNERFIHSTGLGGIQPSSEIATRKEQMMKERRESFREKIHGVGHEIFSTYPRTNRWLEGSHRWCDAKTYIRAVRLRTNTTETRVTMTRGLAVPKTCRSCKLQDESIMHVLQWCDGTRGTRYRRHHNICDIVAGKLREKGYQVFQEITYPSDTSHHVRPDVVCVKGRKAKVLDITVVYERTGGSFIDAYDRRVQRYQHLEKIVKQRHDCDEVEFHGLTVGARGSFFHRHVPIWKSLGFTDADLSRIAYKCLKDSINIFSVFRKSINERSRSDTF